MCPACGAWLSSTAIDFGRSRVDCTMVLMGSRVSFDVACLHRENTSLFPSIVADQEDVQWRFFFFFFALASF